MANLDDSRILDELAEQLFKILAVERGVLVGNRKLDQQCPQAAFRRQRVETFAGLSFVLLPRTNVGCRRRFHHRQGGMGERLQQLGREHEFRVHGGNFAAPDFRQLRLNRSVERRVDLNYVEELRQVLQRMNFAGRQVVGVEDAIPVFVGPARRPDPDLSRGLHT